MAVTKNAKGFYEVRVSKVIGGKQHFKKKGNIRTIGDARLLERQLTTELETYKYKMEESITWQMAVDQYLKFLEENKATSTYYTAKTSLLAHTKKWFDLPLQDVAAPIIKELFQSSLSGATETTKANVTKYIRGVFKLAITNGQAQHNPANQFSFKKDKMGLFI